MLCYDYWIFNERAEILGILGWGPAGLDSLSLYICFLITSCFYYKKNRRKKIMILMHVEERSIFIGQFGVKWFWLCVVSSGSCCVCANLADKMNHLTVVLKKTR